MHVLFLPSWYPCNKEDLSGSFFREQAIALAATGAKVGVIATQLRSLRRPVSALFGNHCSYREFDQGVQTYRASIAHWTPRLWGLTAHRIAKITERIFDEYVADQGRPDVLHVHAALPVSKAAINLAKRNHIPIVYSEHSSAFANSNVGASGLLLTKRLAQNATNSFAVSKSFASLLEEKTGVPIKVMPNSVHSSFLSEPLLDHDNSKIRFLHLSMLNPNKNVSSLLKAFSKAFVGDTKFTLNIGGDGPDRESLEKLAQNLGISEQVKFLGKLSRPKVIDAMANADFFVLPSKYETFGVVLIEALAMGMQVIATQCGGPEGIIEEGDGLLVPKDDIIALATALRRIGTPNSIERRYSLREKCRRRFGPEEIAIQWLGIYEETIKLHKAAN